jgi:hypothetical protein
VRRAKLYYLRGKIGKRARIQEKRQAAGGAASPEREPVAVAASEDTTETAES